MFLAWLDWIWANTAKIRDIAAVLGAIGTVIGIFAALLRVRTDRRLQREINSKRTWAGVLRLSFEHPEFAEPKVSPHTDQALSMRYAWFVSNVLNGLDEILISTDELEWRNVARNMISIHRPWLSTTEIRDTELGTYGNELQELIRKTVAT
jgi:hypothetical protein